MLNQVDESRLGIVKCKQHACEALYRPVMNSDIKETVKNYAKWADFQRKKLSEPLIPIETPELSFIVVETIYYTKYYYKSYIFP